MADMLMLFPAHIKNDSELQDRAVRSARRFGADAPQFFYFDGTNAGELKKAILAGSYGCIFAAYFSMEREYPDLRMIRTLSLRSRLVLYRPDMSLFATAALKNSENAEIREWHDAGKAIFANMLNLADTVIVGDDERQVFADAGAGNVVVTESTLESAPAAAQEDRRRNMVSIIMLTFNQLAMTRQCVESLTAHTDHDYELIVVDNGSADGTKEYLEQLAAERANIKLIFNEKNVGFSKANNQGMRIAKGDYILLLNNDVILVDGWLDRLLLCLDSDPGIGMVGPATNNAVARQVVEQKVNYDDADIQRFACMQLLNNAGQWFPVHRIIGFCMLVKKEVIEKIGMLDERFGPGGFEDYDFCLRVNQAGYKIMVVSDVFVYHVGGQGYHKNNLDYAKLREQNVQIFIEKWCRKALETMEVLPDGI
jgi:GT2 family glycosyltransferase